MKTIFQPYLYFCGFEMVLHNRFELFISYLDIVKSSLRDILQFIVSTLSEKVIEI